MLPLVLLATAPSFMPMSAPARTSSVPPEPVLRLAFCTTAPAALSVMLPLPVITLAPTVMLEPVPLALTRTLPVPLALIALPIVSPSCRSIDPLAVTSTMAPLPAFVTRSDCARSVTVLKPALAVKSDTLMSAIFVTTMASSSLR